MIPVKNNPNLYRDDNGAIINTDKSELDAYRKRRNYALKQQSEMEQMRASINNMNNDISEIKQALKTLIEITR